MKIQERTELRERLILTAMLVNEQVLVKCASLWKGGGSEGLFASRYANTVAGWAIGHLRKYNRPIGDQVEGQFGRWAERSKDAESVELIGNLIESMGEKGWDKVAKSVQPDWVLDQAQEYFTLVLLRRKSEALQFALETGNVEEAQKVASEWKAPDLAASAWTDALRDYDGMASAFDAKTMPLIRLPGDLGLLTGDVFERDSLVGLTGVAKAGKSYTLMDLAYRGLVAGHRVAYITIGDLSVRQVRMRWGRYLTGLPLKNPEGRLIQLPVGFDPDTEDPVPVFTPKFYKTLLTKERAILGMKKLMAKVCPDPRATTFKRMVLSAEAMNAAQLRDTLYAQAQEGWLPDMVVLDYADLVRPPDGTKEERHGIDATWKTLRAISQELHCLLVTATQSDAQGYGSRTLGMKNFSGARQKNDHVNAMIGLNTTEAEAAQQIIRWNFINNREDRDLREVAVVGCPAIGRVIMHSKFCPKDSR